MNYSKLRKTNAILLTLFAVFAGLYFGASFLEPFAFAAFLAMLMAPFSNWLEKRGLGRAISSLLSTFFVFVGVCGVAVLLSYQLAEFVDDLPAMQEASLELLQKVQNYIYSISGVSPEEQRLMLQEWSDEILEAVQENLANFAGSLAFSSLKFLLVVIYVFLLLLNRDKFAEVVLMYVPKEHEEKTNRTLHEISEVAYHYLWGRLKVMMALALMYIIIFLAFGTPYAVLLTIFGALVTIVPYVGPLISGVLPICIMLVFQNDFNTVLLFGIIVLIVQLIESYVLEPIIVGSEIQLSPLAVIVAVIIGGQVWGTTGMILFVPLLAIFKIISDKTASLRPIGYLLGNNISNEGPSLWDKVKRIFSSNTYS
ncbi:AI-2E family transporter [Pontibacter harenae]|uniref:AI-2E family transporter n=1 Tax=Pontibacter harenae TaxID=2894083 RepID=UPI001E44688E|nr:AI-2E family transporter [Pontibacter harenae]MCC9168714.1 AI-2E family transporter [Pontibacter harenae]